MILLSAHVNHIHPGVFFRVEGEEFIVKFLVEFHFLHIDDKLVAVFKIYVGAFQFGFFGVDFQGYALVLSCGIG